jgi:polyhydroxyalkanoate synthase
MGALEHFAETFDRAANVVVAHYTLGLSPAALAEAYFDWLTHLACAPGKQLALIGKALRKSEKLARYAAACVLAPDGAKRCIEPLPQDRRFSADAWQKWPFNLFHQAFLLQQQWWHNATTDVHGVTKQHERQMAFVTRQLLDVVSPSNFIFTNPVVFQQTQKEFGENLLRGFRNFLEDWERNNTGQPPAGLEAFEVGKNIAVSPGKVIYRNRLIELIQYSPATGNVRPEPLLIVPAWIMKYYILDLSPRNSLVKYLTDQGFTVFMISWKNPDYGDRDLGLDDYLELGIKAALGTVQKLVPNAMVHGVGYCLGGTLLAIAAAALACNGGEPFQTLSFLAAQVDFEEAGELTLFITESQVTFLEDMMWQQGYLSAQQMSGTFQLLRSNDLIWSRGVHDYLMGERQKGFDLLAWNADSTRMPYRMHSEYLRQLFLDNDLAEGRYKVGLRTISLTDIRAPVFAVGTESDHVAPWRSAYKFHLFLDTSVTFLLTNGGHNAGVVSEPGREGRHYRMRTKEESDLYLDPEAWFEETPTTQDSWWPAWASWLHERSGKWAAPPAMGGAEVTGLAPLADAPGSYVFGK